MPTPSIEWLQREVDFKAGGQTLSGRVTGIEGVKLDHARIVLKDGTVLDNVPVSGLRATTSAVRKIVTFEQMNQIPERKYERKKGNGDIEEVTMTFQGMLKDVLGIGVTSWENTLKAAEGKRRG